MKIREAAKSDFEQIWPIFHEIVSAGETYAYPRNTSREDAENLWMHAPHNTFVAEEEGEIIAATWSLHRREARVSRQPCASIHRTSQ